MERVSLSSGNGGSESNSLIKDIFYKNFSNEILLKDEDGAHLKEGLVVSTDSFTVSPLFFRGGDIGKLSICGSCNDVAMMGAKPQFLSVGFIIEEGFSVKELEKIVESMAKELAVNDAKIVCGDTKVVPKGAVDKLFINTTAFGYTQEDISAYNLKEDDVVIVSGDIARHGATIFAAREGIELQSQIQSDCASLSPLVQKLLQSNIKPKAMRDATRGGVAAVLNEWAQASDVCIEVQQDAIPISKEVEGICEILGFDATVLANEGTFVLCVKKEDVDKTLEILHQFETAKNAKEIGKISSYKKQKVLLHSSYGTIKPLDMPSGEILPRIC